MFDDEGNYLILDDLIRYADHNRDFKRDFVDGCYDFREKNGYLTENQMRTLDSIHQTEAVQTFLEDY